MPLPVPRYTVDQVRGFPPDGQRYELLDGVLLVTPAPRNLHQVVVGHLFARLYQAVVPPGLARVVSVGELEIGDHTLLNPDILVYPASYQVDTAWKDIRHWWLAVEVLSPSSERYDRDFKRPAYQAIGVEEFWLVDPDGKTVEVWDGGEGAPRIERERIVWRPAGSATPIEIELRRIWEG
ncbi:MAG: Uma2 family endonuclease [Gemmatimonadales bacterium]